MAWIRKGEVSAILARQFGMEYRANLGAIEESVVALLPRELALRYGVVPLTREVSGASQRVKIAISDPMDCDTVDELRKLLQIDLDPVVVPKQEIKLAIAKYYGSRKERPRGNP